MKAKRRLKRDESSSLGYVADAERARDDKVISDNKNAVKPSFDNNTLTKAHHSNNDTFKNVFALEILNHEQLEVKNYIKVGEGRLIGPELVQETTEKIKQINDRLKIARDRVVRFGNKGKLAPRFVGQFEIIEKVGPVAYRLDLPKELNGIYDTFHVSNLKKCLADPTLQVILEKEFKKLKRSRVAIVKVRWNSKRGPEFTWKREDQMKMKYPYLFCDISG
uniref:Putative reverse transcriptase domain-containing protein n=1 Tax=Tanacetum cinerariifolium TaxID=118510 RepID=A0A699HHW3_TANCI|nr:putative reverse transcriptase domain-containing protein [Tanacetum cinerariifolium]